MPQTIKNEATGEEETFYSQAELDAIADEKAAAEIAKVEADSKQALDALEEEKSKLEKDLEGYKDKDYNFSKLRDKKDKTDDNAGETKEEMEKRLQELNEKIDAYGNQSIADIRSDFVREHKILSDKDTKEKFDYYYEKLGANAKTKDEIIRASQEALTLVSDGQYDGSNDQSMHSMGADQNYRRTNPDAPSPESKKMGDLLGVTDEDRKKYGRK